MPFSHLHFKRWGFPKWRFFDLDIGAAGNEQVLLGEDLIHYIAQWGAQFWGVDDLLFNLEHLRADLQAKHAVYLGRETFQGQQVYRIRWHDMVVLLNRLPATQVPATFREARIPAGFRIGVLPMRSWHRSCIDKHVTSNSSGMRHVQSYHTVYRLTVLLLVASLYNTRNGRRRF